MTLTSDVFPAFRRTMSDNSISCLKNRLPSQLRNESHIPIIFATPKLLLQIHRNSNTPQSAPRSILNTYVNPFN
ncbi:hypothetical protein M758_UG151200 [Ceratodon purpureus]|nr:hypothetical protein M758_UG151200 [Ceratodon purpureus]